MRVEKITKNKKQYLDLLLLADESENMIDRYLESGDMFAIFDDDVKTVCVVAAIDKETCELKNIATYEKYQGKGYGKALIKYISDFYKNDYKIMLVGTGDTPAILSFYENCGFEISHRLKNFFTDNYDHPMFEDGIQLIDMVYLKKKLIKACFLNREQKVKQIIQMKSIEVRQAVDSDVERITQLFFDTIQNINIKDYSQEEVDDWSSWKSDIDKWLEKMQEQYFVVAEIDNKFVGFSSLAKDGYLDFMFVHKDNQGQGVASALLSEIERKAMEQNNDLIYSDVSITAKGFFESKGFIVERQQLKKSKQKELINFRMIKNKE